MASSFLTPNMSLVVPVVGQEFGPSWASDLNSSLVIVDAHSHLPGSGVQITPAAININADLSFNSINNAINLRSLRFAVQGASLSLASDLSCLYSSPSSTGDLWFNDGSGNQIRITQSGTVAGSSGTITGLPSGTASASYQSGSGTFQFQQATSTAANIDVGSLIVRYPGSYPTPSGNAIIIEAPSSLSSLYALVLPQLPVSTSLLSLDTVGNITTNAIDAVVNSLTVTSTPLTANGSGLIVTNAITGASDLTIAGNTGLGGTLAVNSGITINSGGLTSNGGGGILATGLVTAQAGINVTGNASVSGFVTSNGTMVTTAQSPQGYQLGVLRGVVNAAGTVTSGEGFSVSSNGAGTYTITFTNSFVDTPAVTTNSNGGNLRIGDILSASSGSCSIFFPAITPFSFIAIGRHT